MFRAMQSDRYARQEVIKTIQEKRGGRKLLIYEANIWSRKGDINRQDMQPFGDLLDQIRPGDKVDLLIQSPGGDIDVAEQIVYMCRQLADDFQVIVPECAKSAATLIALASDKVIMGLPSELGPIDPQLIIPGPGGAPFQISVLSFLDGFDKIKEEVEETGKISPIYYPLLHGFNPGFLELCRNAQKRSREFAQKWLKQYMCKNDSGKAEMIVAGLCDPKKWLSHGAAVNADEALKLGINVEKLSHDDELWDMIWYLHCCYGVFFRQDPEPCKIYESEIVSLPFG